MQTKESELILIPERTIMNRCESFSANLRTDKNDVSERAKRLVALAKRSPNHGKHGKLKTTLIKEEVQRILHQKLLERSFKLLNTQTIIAHGTISVFKVKSEWVGVGKKRWLKKGKPQLVTNDNEIASAINWEYGNRDEDDNPNSDEEYFFIMKNAPDTTALKDQISRVLGPTTQKIDVTSGGKEIKQITGMEIINEESKPIIIHEDSISL